MVEITDDFMRAKLATVRDYVVARLTRPPEQARIVWEHGRRNMQMQADGKMALVGPVMGGGDLVGLCIFAVPEVEARAIMDGDGAVQAGIFLYDLTTWYGFPGDTLPAE